MFGLLSPARRDKKYCQAYAHVCRSHRENFGLSLLSFHSYESILLYLLSVDAGAVTLSDKAAVRCCQLTKRAQPGTPSDLAVSRFCAAFSLLLAYVKLKDDSEDDSSLRAKFLLWYSRKQFDEAFAFFQTIDPSFTHRITSFLHAHAEIERQQTVVDLVEFSRPTGEAFGYLFGLLAKCWGMPERMDTLIGLGNAIGRAIICFDVAVDYDADAQLRRFNPLKSRTNRKESVLLAKGYLSDASCIAGLQFGEGSLASALCKSVESTLRIDEEGEPNKVPSVTEEDVPAAFEMVKAFGFVPLPVLATSDSDSTMCCLVAGCIGIAVIGKGCCQWEGELTERGPCGQKKTKKTRRTGGPCE